MGDVFFERDHDTGQLWKVERGHFGTKIRTLVSGPTKHEPWKIKGIPPYLQAEIDKVITPAYKMNPLPPTMGSIELGSYKANLTSFSIKDVTNSGLFGFPIKEVEVASSVEIPEEITMMSLSDWAAQFFDTHLKGKPYESPKFPEGNGSRGQSDPLPPPDQEEI